MDLGRSSDLKPRFVDIRPLPRHFRSSARLRTRISTGIGIRVTTLAIAPIIERCGLCTDISTVIIPTLGMTTADTAIDRMTTVAGEYFAVGTFDRHPD